MKKMYVYKVTRTDEDQGYDTFDSFVVVTTSGERAREIVPGHGGWREEHDERKVETFDDWEKCDGYKSYTWISADQKDTLVVEKIGKATCGPERYVLCSFNAG